MSMKKAYEMKSIYKLLASSRKSIRQINLAIVHQHNLYLLW